MLLYMLIHTVFRAIYWLVIIRVLVSWVRPNVRDKLVLRLLRLLYNLTEPILSPFRRLVPANYGVDFSPIIALLAMSILERIIISLIF